MASREEIAERAGEQEKSLFVAELFANLEAKIDHRFNQLRRMFMATKQEVAALNDSVDAISSGIGDVVAELTEADNNILAELQRLNAEHEDIDLSGVIAKVQDVNDKVSSLKDAADATKNLVPADTTPPAEDTGTTDGGDTTAERTA